jgi:hypothetical protein
LRVDVLHVGLRLLRRGLGLADRDPEVGRIDHQRQITFERIGATLSVVIAGLFPRKRIGMLGALVNFRTISSPNLSCN